MKTFSGAHILVKLRQQLEKVIPFGQKLALERSQGIERLLFRMKERFKMRRVYKRGAGNIWCHVLKFMNLLHILANVTGTYGV